MKKRRRAPRIPAAKRRKVAELVLAGWSIQRVARELKIDRKTVAIILDEQKVQRPASTRAPKEESKPRPEFREDYQSVGDAPQDLLATQDWLYRSLLVSARHVMLDPSYESDERARRRELREIARTAVVLIPRSRLRRAEDTVRGDLAKLNQDAGPEYQNAQKPARPRYRSPTRRS